MVMTLRDLLQPQVILDVVSRIRKGQGRLSRWFGFYYNSYDTTRGELVGPNIHDAPARHGSYRIFDRTRTIAQGRAPGAGPATWQPQPYGQVNFTIPRFHEKVRLDAEELQNLASSVGPNSVLDPGGQEYITRQQEFLITRFNNAIEFMCAGLIRGKWYFRIVGDDAYPTLTLPTTNDFVTIDYKFNAGNLNQLNMLGTGNIIGMSWANPDAPIISNDLPKMAEAFAQLTGYAMTDAFIPPRVWGYLLTNVEVMNTAGSANQPFTSFEFVPTEGQGMYPYNEWVSVLRGYPTIRWHILPEYLIDNGGTDTTYAAGTGVLTPVIPDNSVAFMPPVGPDWVDMISFREAISEQVGEAMSKKSNPWFWSQWMTQPTCIELLGIMNCLPRLRIPRAMVLPTVVFP